MNLDNLFERLSEVSFGATPVPALPQADLLLVLCLHGAKHRWYSLGWICDVAELIRCDLDWDDLFARADRLGVRRILSLGLHLAAGLLRAPVPAPIRRVVESDLAVGRLAVEVQENLLNEGAASWGTWEVSTFYLRCRERLADRLWFTVGEALTLTAGDFAFWPLPDRLFRLYHLIRPVRLAAKYAHRVLPERERSKA